MLEERHKSILEILEAESRVSVEHLSARLEVSEVTIRKDLSTLDEQGLLERVHGGAVFNQRSRFNAAFLQKLQLQDSEKRSIARAAAGFVQEGDTLILDAGTTTLAFAQELANRFRSLYVITNSVPVAMELAKQDFEILLVGGQIRNHSLALIGPAAVKTLAGYHADRAFLGTSGVSIARGFSTPHPLDAEVKEAMIRSADQSFVLTDASKFEHDCLATFAHFSDIFLTITDSRLPKHLQDQFSSHKVQLVIADPDAPTEIAPRPVRPRPG